MVGAFSALSAAWGALIEATGGSTSECDRGDCGALGEFTMETTWPLIVVVFVALACLLAWFVSSRVGR